MLPVESLVLRTGTMMHGMTRTLRLAGVSTGTICNMYGLHTPLGACPGFWIAP